MVIEANRTHRQHIDRYQNSDNDEENFEDVPNFRGAEDNYNDFVHILLNHFHPTVYKTTEEEKINYIRNSLRAEANNYWQTITITFTTTLNDVIQMFPKEFAKEDMREVARYKRNKTKFDILRKHFANS